LLLIWCIRLGSWKALLETANCNLKSCEDLLIPVLQGVLQTSISLRIRDDVSKYVSRAESRPHQNCLPSRSTTNLHPERQIKQPPYPALPCICMPRAIKSLSQNRPPYRIRRIPFPTLPYPPSPSFLVSRLERLNHSLRSKSHSIPRRRNHSSYVYHRYKTSCVPAKHTLNVLSEASFRQLDRAPRPRDTSRPPHQDAVFSPAPH
jgi:hypothetical protein